MDIPAAFRTMCLKTGYEVATPRFTTNEGFTTYLLSGFTADELDEIAEFIRSLLDSGISDAEWVRIWRQAGSAFYMTGESEGGVADAFKVILSAIDERRRTVQ